MKQHLSSAGLMAALMVVSWPNAALAQVKTYYHAGAWDAFSGRDDKEGAVCGISTSILPDNRRLAISFDIGGSNTTFSASKPDWSIPENTRVTVVIQAGLNAPRIAQGTGHEHVIAWTLPPAGMQTFDRDFRQSPSMTVTFPEGSEAPWTVSLAGSTVISDTFGRCIRDLTRQVQTIQAPAGNQAPPNATQPFSSALPGSAPTPSSSPAPDPTPAPAPAPVAR